MSEIKVNKISPATGTEITLGDSSDDFLLPSGAEIIAQSGSTITIASGANIVNSGAATGFGAGLVLQVVTNHITTASSQTNVATTPLSISNLNTSITPASTGSKILVQIQWCGEHSNIATEDVMFGIHRGSTRIGDGVQVGVRGYAMIVGSAGYQTEAGSSLDFASYQYIDSPSTASSVTYHAYMVSEVFGGTLYNNRTVADGNATAYERGSSSITLTELSAATVLVNGV